ncbi:MAG: hypothetical protein CENE_01894 [Candidatus Celerinatantimonas neptuna]|nr:MAG: hypothetical protein CENE_01894 [Candidatus Celerinatantimonas neptuna]
MKRKLILILFGLCFSLNCMARVGVFPESTFDQLSYGLYWFGANNQYQKASKSTQSGGLYYNPSKPTLIFIHGWQKNHIKKKNRFVFWEKNNGFPNIDFANLWISQGYNVGILYWDQFADESEVKNAEAKIWSVKGPKKMRWLDSYGTYHSGPSKNVTQLLLANYRIAMKGFKGSKLRFAGHSLGNQVALRLANQLETLAKEGEISKKEVPERVSLLDPFYSNYAKSYLNGKWVGEKARTIVKRIKAYGIAIDSYRTSALTATIFVGDQNKKLENSVAFEEEKTKFFNQLEQSKKHDAAIWLYLWSINYSTPTVSNSSMPGLSAASTNSEVKQWMATTNHLVQTSGGKTKNPKDNVFKLTGAL